MERAPMMAFCLEYDDNTVELGPGEHIVGRGIGCQLRFNDAAISRRHLRLAMSAAALVAEDLGSHNGTLLNGRPLIGITELKDGDELQVGFRRLRIRLLDEFDAPPEEETQTNGHASRRLNRDLAFEAASPGSPDLVLRVLCPSCRQMVSADAGICPSCSYRWPSGRPMSVTQEFHVGSMAQALNRRDEQRYRIEMPVIYSSDTLTFDATTRNLSRGGVFIETEILDEIATTCEVTMLPDGRPVHTISGLVRRVVAARPDSSRINWHGERPGMAVQFKHVTADAAAWLEALLSEMKHG